ncbi:MAG: TonB-dependent receptor plug domain-containing protein, partial [Chitinophagales bacterium]
MKNILSTLLIAFCCCSVSIAQQATVSGTVKDASTHETLNGVTVSLGNNNGTVTDEAGKYDISIDAGEYNIEFSYLGYEKQSRHVNLKSGTTSTMNIELNQISNELNLVVVTASKYEKDISKETVSMEVLKPEFLSNSNTIDLDEAIQKVPGMTVIDNQANVRGGSGFSYGAGSRVLVLVDGIPELTGDAGDVKWEFLPVENVEQVEIIKGASSVLYGSSALNGVINLRTRYPTAEPETRITAFQGIYQNPKDKGKVWWGNQQPYFGGGNFMHSRKFGQFDLVVGGNINNDQSFHEGQYNLRGRINANTRYRFKKIDGLSTGLNINYMYYHSGTYFLWADDTTGAYRALGGLDSATTTVSE